MKILHIALNVRNGSGGKVIQDRNRKILEQYCEGNFLAVTYDFGKLSYCLMKKNLFTDKSPSFRIRLYRGLRRTASWHLVYRKLKKTAAAFRPDYIFCDNSIISVADKNLFRKYKFITFFHNIEKNYYEQQFPDYLSDPVKHKYHDCIAENEQFICDHAEKIICINQRDSDELQENYGRGADLLLQTSMEDIFDERYIRKGTGDYLLFVGTDFFGNTDGLFWFIENCMDDITIPLVVAGSGMDKYAGKYPDKKVTFYGFAEDLGEYYRDAAAVVLPIISGSGMKTKTCEAFMFGKTVIGTNEAFEGYADYQNSGAQLANTKDEFIQVINEFTKEQKNAYSDQAREYFLENYSFEKSREKLSGMLDSLK